MIQLGTVTGQEIKPKRGTDIDVRMLQVELGTSAQSDPQSVEYIPLSGDDNPPMKDDKVLVLSIGPAFKIGIGIRDAIVTAMNAGERKLYSRDSGGAVAAFMNLLDTGIMELNGNADFAVRFTNLESMVTSLNSKYDAHTHPDPVSGSTGTPSNAPLGLDISGAKVDEVKLP